MHSLRRHSNSNWKRQLSINKFERSKNYTSFVGTFKSQLKKPDHYRNDYKDDRPLHSLLGHSSFKWKKLASFIGTFKSQLKKPDHYRNDYKDDITLHSLWGHSITNWKRQFSIEMISNMKEPYILCWDIEIPIEIDGSVLKWLQRWQNLTFLVGTFKFRLKKQFSIEMISKITALYILCGDIQVSTEKKNTLVLKWFQRWQNHAFFVETFKFQLKNHFSILMISTVKELTSSVGTFKSQLKNTDYYWNDYKDDRPLHSLLGHSSFKWKKLTSFIGTFKIQLEKTVHYSNDFKDDRTLHSLWGHSNSNWKRQFNI